MEKRQDVNIIHMIVGDNTEMQLDMDGSIVMDITGMIADCTPGNPILIKYNRCIDEDRVVAKLNMDKMRQQMLQQGLLQMGMMPTNSNTVKGKCSKCGQVTDLPIINGKVQPCKQCQLIDSKVRSAKEDIKKDVQRVDISDEDKQFIKEWLANNEKKPIRKKRPVKKKEDINEGENNIQ